MPCERSKSHLSMNDEELKLLTAIIALIASVIGLAREIRGGKRKAPKSHKHLKHKR